MVIPERHSGKEFLGIYDGDTLVRVGDLRQLMLTVAFSSSCDRGPMPLLEPLRQVDSSSRLETFSEFDSKSTGAHSEQYSVLVYSAVGTKVGTFQRQASVLGVKHLSWSPNGRFLAVGGYDGAVRILESESWQPISVVRGFENGALVEEGELGSDAVVHCELKQCSLVTRRC